MTSEKQRSSKIPKPFRILERSSEKPWSLEVFRRGFALPQHPMLNKGTAFTPEERDIFGLRGLLPPTSTTMAEQLDRVAGNYARQTTDIDRYLFLIALQDRNEGLFYRFCMENLEEILPIVYTPTVGQACQEYSHIYRRPRGLYVTLDDIDRIDELLDNVGKDELALLVVTDGERILGTGDQGTGGIGISIGKLSLYSLGAGIHPSLTLPVVMDVGTDNQKLLGDPLYVGTRKRRERGEPYYELLEAFVEAVHDRWPRAIVQWEDLAKDHAFSVLDRFRERVPSFNDDIQGTGAVVLAALRSALSVAGVPLDEARILFFGAGAANVGTARAIAAARGDGNASPEVQRRNLVFLDSRGLLHMGRRHVDDYKQPWALSEAEMRDWPDIPDPAAMAEAIDYYKPHVLLGASGMAGAFTEKFVQAMGRVADRPIIFALSNPTSHCEARPVDLHRWTEGRAIFATGSPFPPVETADGPIHVAQANNMLVFPGVGLGAYVAGASRITDEMFAAAATAVSDTVTDDDRAHGKILPSVADIREVSHSVALGVAREAMSARLAHKISEESLEDHIRTEMWKPDYMELVPGD